MRLDIPTDRKLFQRQQESYGHSPSVNPAGRAMMRAFIAVTLVTHKRRSDLHRHCKARGRSFNLDAQAGRLLHALDRFSVERSHS
jgi:hypothetical protein